MNITVNGTATRVDDAAPMSALVEQLGLTGRRIAVEVNEELIPRSRFDEHRLNEGDRVEIIHAVGGG
jgi:sulfur carrier protein